MSPSSTSPAASTTPPAISAWCRRGTEYAFGGGWSFKAEYLYVDLGRASTTSTNLVGFAGTTPYPSNVYTHSVDLKSNIVRVGVNYKFGGPVVARY